MKKCCVEKRYFYGSGGCGFESYLSNQLCSCNKLESSSNVEHRKKDSFRYYLIFSIWRANRSWDRLRFECERNQKWFGDRYLCSPPIFNSIQGILGNMGVIDKNAEQILCISKPERLFSKSGASREYQKLRSKWHPDRNSDSNASNVFFHVTELYDAAKKAIAADTWDGPATLDFTLTSGKTFRLRYKKFHTFELGKFYISDTKVIYVIDKEYKKFYENGVAQINGIRYDNTKLKTEFSKYFPTIRIHGETANGFVVVMDKTKDLVLLQDLIDHVPDKAITPEHTAWIVGSLYNLTTFFDFSEVVHNGITPLNYFVSPTHHSGALLGGWWYSTAPEAKLIGMPTKLARILPKNLFLEKKAKTCYDRLAIKATAIACMGDPTLNGSRLLLNKNIPQPLLQWARSPAPNHSALEDYQDWDTVLHNCFGSRKFVEFDVDVTDIY